MSRLARVGHLVQHVGQGTKAGCFDERAREANVLVVVREGVDRGKAARERSRCS
ncbi:hypothetical protein OHU11_39225 [Streptomyces sp. NBC_00257]|uniref:hypothetical protein n=1 Tax=unclassified Streptomyces TaxID=2593676 RepID=UPI00225656C9|nr:MULTISPECIES: hypothetical protein [unclassified Streptomyces]WTB52346.1 hypothetical protein OG832_03825 [Streptomyces sp. NBC_00826]WTH94763.1 hypothetical protein OIC43_39860 [Streptomyces sp. NBC_00825]WTI03497.1 hypothetical protein OHA23_39835 [Streptomyces sp. NBC_00822]MCX4869062.1 hypothetical protein [Streptomyces sp. NBC_00906]MCX4900300.1 hypothetical protein [Streptomyces sp. NBC_00892]